MKPTPLLTPANVIALRLANVVALFAFGSRVIGRAGSLSDTDIAVLLREPVAADRSLEIAAHIEMLVGQAFPALVNVELTILNTAPVTLQINALKRGEVMLTLDPVALADFRASVMQRAGDLLPVLRAYRADRLRSQYV